MVTALGHLPKCFLGTGDVAIPLCQVHLGLIFICGSKAFFKTHATSCLCGHLSQSWIVLAHDIYCITFKYRQLTNALI